MLLRNSIGDSEHVVESIGPELDVQIGTNKQCAYGTADSSVGALNRSILVGGISTSRVNSVLKLSKKVTDLRIPEQFATLIHVCIFGLAVRGVLVQEVSEPFDRR